MLVTVSALLEVTLLLVRNVLVSVVVELAVEAVVSVSVPVRVVVLLDCVILDAVLVEVTLVLIPVVLIVDVSLKERVVKVGDVLLVRLPLNELVVLADVLP
eukprot:8751569-Pyramimonas_sp.AAC.1